MLQMCPTFAFPFPCFFSAHDSQEGGEEEEREEEEVLGVFFCKRERSLRSGGSHDVDLITWEDDEEGYERGEEVAGVDDGRDKCIWNHLLSIVNMLPLSYISQISKLHTQLTGRLRIEDGSITVMLIPCLALGIYTISH